MIRDAFRSHVRPVPSPHFDRKLRAALIDERRRRDATRAKMRVMRSYWIVAGAAIIGILSALPWSESPAGAWAPLLTITAMVALPMMLVRLDLIDVILDSAESLRDG